MGEPAVCNLKGSVAVSARHADFWYLIGGLAHTHNGPYFPKYIILIAMMFVFISALQGCAPGFQIHWHSPSLLCEDYCYATVCAIRRPRELQTEETKETVFIVTMRRLFVAAYTKSREWVAGASLFRGA